ncbi:hypothetical protein T09_9207 [Trichinella sp. T9]|nr:hypothetical protein T09_9207 [Trichinella sp. T9]
MDFQMPLLPTVENTQPKGQKLANELENELDVRSVHLKIEEDNFKFRINQSHYFISSFSFVYSLKNNKIQKNFNPNGVEGLFATSPSLAFSHHGNIVDLLALFSPCSDQFRSRLCAIPG